MGDISCSYSLNIPGNFIHFDISQPTRYITSQFVMLDTGCMSVVMTALSVCLLMHAGIIFNHHHFKFHFTGIYYYFR